MNRWTTLVLIFLYSCGLQAKPVAHVFVSFSMPKVLLLQTLNESARLNIPAYLNGLYENSMEKTAKKLQELAKDAPDLNLFIDPTLFERFDIKQVPALVVVKNERFDVLYGNLSLKNGLQRIADSGGAGLSQSELKGMLDE